MPPEITTPSTLALEVAPDGSLTIKQGPVILTTIDPVRAFLIAAHIINARSRDALAVLQQQAPPVPPLIAVN